MRRIMLKLGIRSITGIWLNPPSLCLGLAIKDEKITHIFLLIFLIEIESF